MKSVPFILSLAHRDRIDRLCKVLTNIGLKHFVGYIVFNNGQTFVLSSMFHMLEPYYIDGYYKEDFSFKREITESVSHYLCDTTQSVSATFQDALENRFSIFRAYYIVRNCPECQFVFGAIKDTRIDNYKHTYKATLNSFEDFCCAFIDSMIDIIKQHNPTYTSSIVLNDKYYRRKIIKSSSTQDEKLTAREIDCLYWAANGKSSEETAMILGINKNT